MTNIIVPLSESNAGAKPGCVQERSVTFYVCCKVAGSFNFSDADRLHRPSLHSFTQQQTHRRGGNLDSDPEPRLICESRLLSLSVPLVLYLPMTQCTEADLQFNRETLKCLLMPDKYALLQSAGDAVSANVLIKLF